MAGEFQEQDRFHLRSRALCSCPNQISATVAPEASVDRRFPLQRFIQMDWNSPVSNRLLLEASAIHRVERWGGMHLQTGKGDNIDAIAPGMVPVIDNPSLATGASLNYRAFATTAGGTFNNSWNWNIHYRPQCPTSRVRTASRSVSTTPTAITRTPATPTRRRRKLYLRERCADAAHVSNHASHGSGERGPRPRALCAGQVDCGPMDARRWRSLRPLQEQLPAAGSAKRPWRRISTSASTESRITRCMTSPPKMGVTYDLFGNGKTALKVTLNKYWKASEQRERCPPTRIPSIG